MTKPWVPFDLETWEAASEAIPRPWPAAFAAFDLRTYQHLGRKPGRVLLAKRWGWADHGVRALLKSESWISPVSINHSATTRQPLPLHPTPTIGQETHHSSTSDRHARVGVDHRSEIRSPFGGEGGGQPPASPPRQPPAGSSEQPLLEKPSPTHESTPGRATPALRTPAPPFPPRPLNLELPPSRGTAEPDPLDVALLLRQEQDANEDDVPDRGAGGILRAALRDGWTRDELAAWFTHALALGVRQRRWRTVLGAGWAESRNQWRASAPAPEPTEAERAAQRAASEELMVRAREADRKYRAEVRARYQKAAK